MPPASGTPDCGSAAGPRARWPHSRAHLAADLGTRRPPATAANAAAADGGTCFGRRRVRPMAGVRQMWPHSRWAALIGWRSVDRPRAIAPTWRMPPIFWLRSAGIVEEIPFYSIVCMVSPGFDRTGVGRGAY